MHRLLIALALLLAPTAVRAEWHRATTDHFVIYADQDEAWLRAYADKLERFDSAARRLRNLPEAAVPGANRVTVYILDPAFFRTIAGGRNVGGFYSPEVAGSKIFLPLGDSNGLGTDATLFHEYTHHLYSVAWSGIALPGWLNEGLAELNSTAELRSDGSMVFGREPPHREHNLRALTTDEVARMLTTSTASTGLEIYYSGGWLLTHMLSFGQRRADALPAYLVAINQGQDLQQAAQTAFGDVRGLQTDLARYRRGTSIGGAVVPAADLSVGAIDVRPLSAGQAATLTIAIRSQRGVTPETAPGLHAEAVAAAAAWPNDPAVQRMLAETAYDAGDFAASLAAAEAAIAADPALAGAHAYKARALQAQDAPPAAVRAALDAGLAASPNDAQLLMLYYESFAAAGRFPDTLARQRLYQAFRIAPEADALRMTTAYQLIADSNPAEANAVLRPLGISIHRSAGAEHARAIMDAIAGGDLEIAMRVAEQGAAATEDAATGEGEPAPAAAS